MSEVVRVSHDDGRKSSAKSIALNVAYLSAGTKTGLVNILIGPLRGRKNIFFEELSKAALASGIEIDDKGTEGNEELYMLINVDFKLLNGRLEMFLFLR